MTQQQKPQSAKAKSEASKARRRKSPSRSAPVWKLDLPIKTRKTSKRLSKGVQETVFENGGYAGVSQSITTTRKARIKRIRNPYAPDTINELLGVIPMSYPIWKEAIGWLKAWMQFRAAREIKIKVGENEIVVKGYMRTGQLEKLFQQFQKQIQEARTGRLKVTLPKGVNHRFPRDLTMTSRRKKS